MNRIVGVKAYGWDWSSLHRLSMAQAAARMAAQGIDWALVQNLIDPLPGSAVDQQRPAGLYDDRQWVATLQDSGRRVFQSTAMFFDPQEFVSTPDLRPVDQHGQVFEPLGWYHGLCPTHPGHLERKAERLAQAVHTTAPDGVFLSFTRFPGFWEMWLPGTQRSQMREYCFCERCINRFAADCAIELPAGGPQAWRPWIVHELRAEWTGWKCRWIAQAALRLRQAAQQAQPGLEFMLNGFGLGSTDFDNAIEEMLGQRFAELDVAFDHYELMFYTQILKRDPAEWMPPRIREVKAQTPRTVLACLQGQAEYLEPMYADGQRERVIDSAHWEAALRAAASAGADGVLTYSWRDLLADEARGGTRVQSMQRFKDGSL